MCLKYHYTYSPCQHTEALCTEPCINLGFPLGEHPNQSDNHVFSSQDLGDPGSDCPECIYAFKSYPAWLTQGTDIRPDVESLRTTGIGQQTTRLWVQDRRTQCPSRRTVAHRPSIKVYLLGGSGAPRVSSPKRYRVLAIQDSSEEGLFELDYMMAMVEDPNSIGNGGRQLTVEL